MANRHEWVNFVQRNNLSITKPAFNRTLMMPSERGQPSIHKAAPCEWRSPAETTVLQICDSIVKKNSKLAQQKETLL